MTQSKKKCEHCGVECIGNARKRFCSKACSRLKKNPLKDKTLHCLTCGKDFERKTKGAQKYCCLKCFKKDWYLRKRVIAICETCKKEFDSFKYLKKEQRFCSVKCAAHFGGIDRNLPDNTRARSIELFGYACEKCSKDNGLIDLHHIDGNDQNNPWCGKNWVRLCRGCHCWAHKMSRTITRYLTREEILGLVPIGQKYKKEKNDSSQLYLFDHSSFPKNSRETPTISLAS